MLELNKKRACSRKLYQERRAKGLCTACGHPVGKGRHSTCSSCREKARQRRIRRYNDRLARGLCPECGGRRDIEGLQCSKCRAANNLAHGKVPTVKKTHYQNRYINKNRRQGVCPTCGRELDDPALKYCAKCRDRANARYRRDPERVYVQRKLKGWGMKPLVPLCAVCGTDHLRCSRCGKYMHADHGSGVCIWSCVCGNTRVFSPEPVPV